MTIRDPRKKEEGTEGRSNTRAFRVLVNRLTSLANYADTGGLYDLIEGRQPPGSQTPSHVHTRYEERVYVVDGQLTVWAGERKEMLRSGDIFNIPATGTAHALVVTSPSGFAHLIEEAGVPDEGGAPPEPTSVDLERFQKAATELGDKTLGPPGALPTSTTNSL